MIPINLVVNLAIFFLQLPMVLVYACAFIFAVIRMSDTVLYKHPCVSRTLYHNTSLLLNFFISFPHSAVNTFHNQLTTKLLYFS